MTLPGIFLPTLFSRRIPLQPSLFIRAMHPKTEIRPDRLAIKRVLDQGWAGQLKLHGHRAQIHIPPSEISGKMPVLVYNRQGQLHKKALPDALADELRRIFGPKESWTVLDAEWMKSDDRLFVFDILKREGQLLDNLTYAERWALLPRVYASKSTQTLSLLRTVDKCIEALSSTDPELEGLVFKALGTPGFSDTSIVRCRKSPTR